MPWLYEALTVLQWAATVIVLCVALYAVCFRDKSDENDVKDNAFTEEKFKETNNKQD